MIYQVYYGDKRPGQVLFDIEIYMKPDKGEDLWHVELHSHSFISGAIDFILDNLDKSKRDEFKKDSEELEELRGWIWERHQNGPRMRHYANSDMRDWTAYVDAKLRGFCDKYGLHLNID